MRPYFKYNERVYAMMAYKTNTTTRTEKDRNPHTNTVYCKLFSDTVTNAICGLRKKELHNRGGFSCFGCGKEK